MTAIQGIAPIEPLQVQEAPALTPPMAPELPSSVAAGKAGGFGEIVSQGLASINRDLMVGQSDLQQLATGNTENLHQIMIRLEESRISFQLFMQVRNRLLEAYQDVMKMQL